MLVQEFDSSCHSKEIHMSSNPVSSFLKVEMLSNDVKYIVCCFEAHIFSSTISTLKQDNMGFDDICISFE